MIYSCSGYFHSDLIRYFGLALYPNKEYSKLYVSSIINLCLMVGHWCSFHCLDPSGLGFLRFSYFHCDGARGGGEMCFLNFGCGLVGGIGGRDRKLGYLQ